MERQCFPDKRDPQEDDTGGENKHHILNKRKSECDIAECNASKRKLQPSGVVNDYDCISDCKDVKFDNAGCSTSQSCVSKEDYSFIPEFGNKQNGKGREQNTTSLAAQLPELVLKHLFSFLRLEDLLSVQKVCTSWEMATNDTLAWKNAPLDLKPRYSVTQLPSVPYLHTVTGSINGNELLDVLVDNVNDLRKMDCYIYKSGFPTMNFENFIEKFKNLEFIRMYNTVPSFVSSLGILSTRENLKALRLYFNGFLQNVPHVCEVIGNGFSALRKLDIRCMCNSQNSIIAVSDLLRKKVNQLTDLRLSYDDVHSDVLELILRSIKLTKFEVDINRYPEIPLDMSSMVNLKSLTLRVEHDFPQSVNLKSYDLTNVYRKIVFPRNVEHLALSFPENSKSDINIISNAVSSLPNLRILSATNINDPDLDRQLQNIHTLPHLHTVSLTECSALSSVGVECILKCLELRKLEVSDILFTDATYECLKNCKYLGDLELHSCVLNSEKLLPTILGMSYLTNICMYACKQRHYTGKLILFEEDVIFDLNEKLRSECHHVNILCWDF